MIFKKSSSWLLGWFIICLLLLSNCSKSKDVQLSVMSFNLRYDGGTDGLNDWQNRKSWVTGYLDSVHPDIIGTQELLCHQIQDILSECSIYKSIGVGRDDGQKLGEHTAILYNHHLLKLIDSSTFWLSEHPENIGEKGWDAAYVRICTWACFESKDTGYKFFVFNTHFDNESELARSNSAHLILEKIENLSNGYPVMLLGDFNANLSSSVYKILTNNTTLDDARLIAQNKKPSQGTYNAFGKIDSFSNEFLIDHIFISKGIRVKNYLIDVQRRNEQYISDHYPVVTNLSINESIYK